MGEEFRPSSPSPSRSLLRQHCDYVAMHSSPPASSSQLAETHSHAETQALTLGMEGLTLGTVDLTLGTAGLTIGAATLLFAAPAKGQRLRQAGGQPWEQLRCDALGLLRRQPRAPARHRRGVKHGLQAPGSFPLGRIGPEVSFCSSATSIIFPLVLKPCRVFACCCDFP